jgi:hypothetical protein
MTDLFMTEADEVPLRAIQSARATKPARPAAEASAVEAMKTDLIDPPMTGSRNASPYTAPFQLSEERLLLGIGTSPPCAQQHR